jgi:hypothetical protein
MVCQQGDSVARRRKLFLNCDRLGLSKQERIELAQYLLRRDITSFKQLSDEQVNRLLDATEGAELVLVLLAQRSTV